MFYWTIDEVLPNWLAVALYMGIGMAQYLCGLATVTSASRVMYAFARDGGLPGSTKLRQVSDRYKTPVFAIWSVAILTVLAFLPALGAGFVDDYPSADVGVTLRTG